MQHKKATHNHAQHPHVDNATKSLHHAAHAKHNFAQNAYPTEPHAYASSEMSCQRRIKKISNKELQ